VNNQYSYWEKKHIGAQSSIQNGEEKKVSLDSAVMAKMQAMTDKLACLPC
jgi:hypothetical protein